MRNMLLHLALAMLSSRPAAAAVIAPSAAAMSPAQLTSFIYRVGAARVGALGSRSLSALTAPDSSGIMALQTQPLSLAPLARALDDVLVIEGVSHDSFAAYTDEQKLRVLAQAASHAELMAESSLQRAKEASDALRNGPGEHVEALLAQAESRRAYLDQAAAASLIEARARFDAYRERRKLRLRFFAEELPNEITRLHQPDAPELFVHETEGWRAADESLEPRYASLQEALKARMEPLSSGPIGPWTVAQARLLERNLDLESSPSIRRALQNELITPKDLRIFRYTAALRGSNANLQWHADPAREPAKRLYGAGNSTVGGTHVRSISDIRTVERFYRQALESARDASRSAWIERHIAKGLDGLPTGGDLAAARKRAEHRLRLTHWATLTGTLGLLLSLGAALALSLGPITLAVLAASFTLALWALHMNSSARRELESGRGDASFIQDELHPNARRGKFGYFEL